MNSNRRPSSEKFDRVIDGKQIKLYTLKNSKGVEVAITNFGGRIVSLHVPDKNQELRDINLGFDSLDGYLESAKINETYFGAIIGRYGNRIANAKFSIDGTTYKLAANNGQNALHGGLKGFNAVVWDVLLENDQTLKLSYLSVDGEEGYPGNLKIIVTYTLDEANNLKIFYQAETDKKTVVNFTNHAFFNLNGENSGSIINHQLQINASAYTPVSENLIPTGLIEQVEGTPFDFRTPATIGLRIDADHQQLIYGRGYDHNYVFDADRERLHLAAVATGDQSGIEMKVYTDEPAMQFYSGNFISGNNIGKGGRVYEKRCAFCLETQHFPDSPNQPDFPSTLLSPGNKFESTTIYQFGLSHS
jgi:aldose 1-epimerase